MANIKISELNPLLTVEDADVLPIVDNAVTKKVTAAILRSYTQGNSVLLTGAQTVAGIKTFTSQLASSVATGTAPFSVASTTKVTNLNADLLDGLSSADFQATLSGTGIVKSTAGTISYLTDNTANWDTAYNDKINSAAVTGSGTNTLTLTQQDAGTITATWVNGTLIREVRNTTGATLTKGTIVYISGATGNKPTVTKAIATGDSTSAQTFGFIQSDLADNANGYVVVVGDLTGVDTSAFAEGDQLYLSSTVAGAFTSTKQYAPAHLVYVGIVTRSHPTLGQIEVNIQNGYELDELHNVSAQSPSNGDILQYVTSTGLWTKVAGTTTNISEGTNLYFTNARSRSAISLTTTGTSGAATYNSTTGVLNVPNYADGGITSLNGLTALSQTFAVGTSGTDFGISSATSTHTFNLPTASATNRGALSSADWTTFNNKQNALTNPITGTGTTNYLPKFTGTSALGNSLIYDNGTNVGINTTSPLTQLTLNGDLSLFTAKQIRLYNSAKNNWAELSSPLINGDSEIDLKIVTKSGIFYFNPTGSLGIGTTSPAYTLDVNGTARVSGDAYFGTFNGNDKYHFEPFTNLAGGANNAYLVSGKADNNERSGFVLQARNSIGEEYNAVVIEGYNSTATNTPLTIDSTGAATFSSSVTATSLIKSGGTSSQFLKADGSVDSTTYQASLLSNPDGIVAIQSGAIKIEPTAQTLSLGESYATNLKNYFFTNSYKYAPSPVGYEYAKLIQQDLLNPASLILIPSAYKTGKVACSKPTIDLDFTRSNDTATRVNEYGLIEKVRTNKLLQSNTFSTTWQFSGTGTVTTGATDPFGGTTAWTLAKTATSTFLYQSTAGFSGSHTFSIYAKAGTVDQLWLNHDQSSSLSSYFDLTLGTAIAAVGCVATIVSVGGGWYRCSIAGTVATPNNIRIYPASGGSISGTTGNILIYGVQGETGDIATDYIATTSAAVSVGPVANVPRMDYTDSASPRLLLEPQRTNLVTYSEQMDNAAWTKSNASVTANQTTSPSGYDDADLIDALTGTGQHFISAASITYTNAVPYTFSVFAKKGNTSLIQLFGASGVFGSNVWATYNFDTLEVTVGSAATASMVDYGSGWYRLILTGTVTGVATVASFYAAFTNDKSVRLPSFTAANQTFYLWGAQTEQASYPSSYVNTLGAAVTRGADATYKTGISSLIGQTEGTLFAEVDVTITGNGNNFTGFVINDGTSSNLVEFGYYQEGRIQAVAFVGGSLLVNINLPAFGLTTGRHKFAFGYKLNDYVFYVDGVQVGNDTSATVPSTSGLNLYDVAAANLGYSQAILFKTRLTNAQLAELTTL